MAVSSLHTIKIEEETNQKISDISAFLQSKHKKSLKNSDLGIDEELADKMIEPMDLEIRVTSQNKMDKISTMRGMATPQNMLLYKGQKDSLKRLTMKSPLENRSNQRRNQSSLGRHQTNSRLGENRLNSQASRIEQRISRLNNPKQDKQKGEMFFFENQNENKVINVKIDVGGTQK